MMHTVEAYQVFASVATFVAQLDPVPDTFVEVEKRIMRKLFPGHMNWLDTDILKSLRSFGFPREFADVVSIAGIAKVRVSVHEAHRSGGLRVLPRAAALRATMQVAGGAARLGARYGWAASSFLFSLESALLEFKAKGAPAQALLDPSTQAGRREGWQARACMAAPMPRAAAMERALRRRLDHWQLDTFTWPPVPQYILQHAAYPAVGSPAGALRSPPFGPERVDDGPQVPGHWAMRYGVRPGRRLAEALLPVSRVPWALLAASASGAS